MGMGVGIALFWSEGRKSEVTLGMVVKQGQDRLGIKGRKKQRNDL